MLGSGLRYQLYVGRAKGFFRAQYSYSTPLQVKTFRTRCLYLFLCQSLFAPSPPPPFLSGWVLVSISKLFTELLWMTLPGCYPSQGCHGYLHVRLRLFQFTQAPSPHPSIGDGLNRNVKYGSPCQYGSLGIVNQQFISVFTLGLYGWSIQKRRTRFRWKMSSCLVCRFLIFLKIHHKGHASEKFGSLFCHSLWGNLKFCERHQPVRKGNFSWTPAVRICDVSYCDLEQSATV